MEGVVTEWESTELKSLIETLPYRYAVIWMRSQLWWFPVVT